MKDYSNVFWTVLAVAVCTAASALLAMQACDGTLLHLEQLRALDPPEAIQALDLDKVRAVRALAWGMTALLAIGMAYVLLEGISTRSPLIAVGLSYLVVLAMIGPPLIATPSTGEPLLIFGAMGKLCTAESILRQASLIPIRELLQQPLQEILSQPPPVFQDPVRVAVAYPILALMASAAACLVRSLILWRKPGETKGISEPAGAVPVWSWDYSWQFLLALGLTAPLVVFWGPLIVACVVSAMALAGALVIWKKVQAERRR